METDKEYQRKAHLEAAVNSIVIFVEYPIRQPLLVLLEQDDRDYWMDMLERKLKERT
jgi:hypothetical protein